MTDSTNINDDQHIEPPREIRHFALLILAVSLVVVSHLVSARPYMIAATNNVAPAGTAPTALAAELPDDWSAVIARRDWIAPVATLLGHTRAREVRLGWVVREWCFLTLPLVGWRQGDLAAFREDGYGYRLIGLTPDQLRVAGSPWFPWWRFTWGWLVIAALAGFGWAELRWQARRRALLGLL